MEIQLKKIFGEFPSFASSLLLLLDQSSLGSVVDNLLDKVQAVKINVSNIVHNTIKAETEEAKKFKKRNKKELVLWILEDVYKEVPNKGQNLFQLPGQLQKGSKERKTKP